MIPDSHLKPTRSRRPSKPRSAADASGSDQPRILLVSRLLLNDQLWCQGEVVVIEGGRPIHLTKPSLPAPGRPSVTIK
jgi:hypothetical protein